MPKSVIVLIGAFAVGIVLALSSLQLDFPTGWIGGLALIGWTLFARQRWAKLEETTGLEPGAPERTIRIYAVGTALLFGHSITAITYPDIDLHVGSGNYLAIDSWTMIAAMLVASLVVRRGDKIRDERDDAIIARGTNAGFLALIAILILFSFVLGFLPPRFGASITLFMVGNILIAIIVVSLLIKYTVQLIEYGKDTIANFAIGADE